MTAAAGSRPAPAPTKDRSVSRRALLDVAALKAALDEGGNEVALIRDALAAAGEKLDEYYLANRRIGEIVSARAWLIDQVLIAIWERQPWPDTKNISLLAVGGYGRGELLPHSDVDLLILTRGSRQTAWRDSIAR
ncbi:MAG: nucleotidyltransferase domain-containing protein, partial [Gammaproteobacteria bacterium]|nr:nucleotidyltransferase domain-containing protein [Gammaproteobacteria bacterium]